MSGRTVVIATPEPLGHRRAGPAVRAIRMAEAVAGAGHAVTLVATDPTPVAVAPAEVTVVGTDAAPRDAEVYIVTGRAMLDLAWVADTDAVVGVDLYDPFQLEALHRGGTDRIRRIDLVEGAHLTLAAQLTRGDRFFCANEAQRSLWLGYLGAMGRLNPAQHEADPTGDHLIGLAPFGVDEHPPAAGGSPLRAIDGIGPDDPIAIWAGGLHDWLDPVTVVRAAGRLPDTSAVRVVFVAGTTSGDGVRPMAAAARAEADAGGLTGTRVFFHPDWVPHDERGPMLVDAAIGLCAHPAHLETRFSHRTRLLDHLWAGLPTVSTGGDPLSAQLADAGAALTTPPGDDEAMAAALAELTTDADRRSAMSQAATELGHTLRWSECLADLVRWVGDAEPAPDRLDPVLAPRLGGPARPRSLVERLRMQWELEGARGVAERARRRLAR